VNSAGNGIDSINNQNTSKDCGKTGGYWVDGTVTNARFAHGSLILTGTTDGTNRTSASYGLGPDPGLLSVQRGTQLAEPGVNLAGQGLMVFGSIVAPLPMALAQCGAGNCSATGVAMAMLPEISALKAGGTILKLGAASGKGAEIIQKAGGAVQALRILPRWVARKSSTAASESEYFPMEPRRFFTQPQTLVRPPLQFKKADELFPRSGTRMRRLLENEVARLREQVREMATLTDDRGYDFDPTWLEKHDWVVVPVEDTGHFAEEEIEQIVAALTSAGHERCLALGALDLAEPLPSAFELAISVEDLRAFNAECGIFRVLLTSPELAGAISCNEWFNVFAGPAALVQQMIGTTIEKARKDFLEYAKVVEQGPEGKLVALAHRYGAPD
jgi:hypothetical protein